MKVWAVEFELNDFGQNVSHVVKKTYYTHRFFTDRQVYAAMTRAFEHQIEKNEWVYEPTPVTPAFPLQIRVAKFWFSTVNAALSKYKADNMKYPGEGYQEYILPGSRFRFFTLVKPETHNLFIGKKGCVADITDIKELTGHETGPGMTSADIVYYSEMKNWSMPEIHLTDMSARFVVGRFVAPGRIECNLDGTRLAFYSLTRWKV
jgi:hypothetical protein